MLTMAPTRKTRLPPHAQVEVGGKMPLPGLSSDRFAFDTDVDPLGLTQVGKGPWCQEERVGGWAGCVCERARM